MGIVWSCCFCLWDPQTDLDFKMKSLQAIEKYNKEVINNAYSNKLSCAHDIINPRKICKNIMSEERLKLYKKECTKYYRGIQQFRHQLDITKYNEFIMKGKIWIIHQLHYSKCELNEQCSKIAHKAIQEWWVLLINMNEKKLLDLERPIQPFIDRDFHSYKYGLLTNPNNDSKSEKKNLDSIHNININSNPNTKISYQSIREKFKEGEEEKKKYLLYGGSDSDVELEARSKGVNFNSILNFDKEENEEKIKIFSILSSLENAKPKKGFSDTDQDDDDHNHNHNNFTEPFISNSKNDQKGMIQYY